MQRRNGLTLVEIMVALTLIVMMLGILAYVFSTAERCMTEMKGIADLEASFRVATESLRRDLRADHFEPGYVPFDITAWGHIPTTTPRQGFFRIHSPPTGKVEALDPDGVYCYRATDCVLHFTIRRSGNKPGDFFSAKVPADSPLLDPKNFSSISQYDGTLAAPDARYMEPGGTIYNSQWAEVAYFLKSNGRFTGTTPLFDLYRTQYVVVPDNTVLNTRNPIIGSAAGYEEMSCWPGKQPLYFNSPNDLTDRKRRAFDPNNPTMQAPTSLLISDVISFAIESYAECSVNGKIEPYWSPNTFVALLAWETSPTNTGGGPSHLKGIRIVLRLWNAKTSQARQTSIVEAVSFSAWQQYGPDW